MRNHTKTYLTYFQLRDTSEVSCIMCGNQAQDIHHLSPRGMGGSKCADYIENLAALCRKHHLKAEHDPKYNAQVKIQLLNQVIEKVKYDGKF